MQLLQSPWIWHIVIYCLSILYADWFESFFFLKFYVYFYLPLFLVFVNCNHYWQIRINFTLFIGLLIRIALKCSVNFHILSNLSKFTGGISNLARIAKWRAFLKAFTYSSTADVCYQLSISHGVFSLT